ncbi:hypothetical protein NDU88_002125 [Pleurodeles waltl]|uniref:Uncharacterized protein n=1 Tax=Pleurodeles waltl TaxID=8319 RepID=A0AAV7TM67_PLEWA|nr:hypothetical protein NDU88_002125 [Pleurodeles waltl]
MDMVIIGSIRARDRQQAQLICDDEERSMDASLRFVQRVNTVEAKAQLRGRAIDFSHLPRLLVFCHM